ncbi:SpoIIE family protein phosphatase [Streptomyces sp. NA04227]|uniref:ATP-binding SpoIIE family protein phosphatase n=1 Tax=Streptomyces sp. NA04227 TaxID=2742136 RepID=UPI001591E72F|nr:SpoIIE family protein phosphatase [Streptomyces sp. NA04227]QKW11211.1 SpoIIE family protein phosphatase [Streptomyces sp. NA04227]
MVHGFAGRARRAARHRGATPRERFSTPGRLAWLNAASTQIGTTLDLERTAQEFVEFAVPRFADAATVDILERVVQGGEGDALSALTLPASRAMAVQTTPELAILEATPVGEITERTEIPHETVMHTYCMRQRRGVLVSPMRDADFSRVAPTDSAADKMRRTRVNSYIGVPLIARGTLIGMADFVRAGHRRPFSATDLQLAEHLASRAAVFIDNARLYGRERAHVVDLQRTLLPRATPHTPGLSVHAAYAPAADTLGVGGDWYDVMALPSGRTALMVGDVMGHGLPAAATMGRLRAVARTLMTQDMAPERVLARLELATRDLEDEQVATCLCAVYDPADSSYTFASAGHPPPLLVEPGPTGNTVRLLEVPVGAPLGAGVIPYDRLRVTATPGTRLVLYTDGLIKSRRVDIDAQVDQLREAAAAMSADQLDGGGLLFTPQDGKARFDEAVWLVAAGLPGAELSIWELTEDGNAAARARSLVSGQLGEWGLSDLTDVTELVVSELVGNALRYGHGPGQLRLLRGERLMVEVSDRGPDLPQIQHAELSDEGGRGLQLINMLCRSWGSCRTTSGKVVWAEQDITSV